MTGEDGMEEINTAVKGCEAKPFEFNGSLSFWPEQGIQWIVEVNVPMQATFRIMKEGHTFCIGKVFYLDHRCSASITYEPQIQL